MLPGPNFTQTQNQTTATMQNTNFTTTEGPIAHRTRSKVLSTAAARAQEADNGMQASRALRAAVEQNRRAPGFAAPPTLGEVQAALPEEGIAVLALLGLFVAAVASSEEAMQEFTEQIEQLAAQDPVTQLIFPKMQ